MRISPGSPPFMTLSSIDNGVSSTSFAGRFDSHRRSVFVVLLCVEIVLLAGCFTTQRAITEGAAKAAAQLAMASAKPWASQARYKAKRQAAGWTVLVNCKKCERPDHSIVSAKYIVRVNPSGKARIVTGVEK